MRTMSRGHAMRTTTLGSRRLNPSLPNKEPRVALSSSSLSSPRMYGGPYKKVSRTTSHARANRGCRRSAMPSSPAAA